MAVERANAEERNKREAEVAVNRDSKPPNLSHTGRFGTGYKSE